LELETRPPGKGRRVAAPFTSRVAMSTATSAVFAGCVRRGRMGARRFRRVALGERSPGGMTRLRPLVFGALP
jgi:hypothetical protein